MKKDDPRKQLKIGDIVTISGCINIDNAKQRTITRQDVNPFGAYYVGWTHKRVGEHYQEEKEYDDFTGRGMPWFLSVTGSVLVARYKTSERANDEFCFFEDVTPGGQLRNPHKWPDGEESRRVKAFCKQQRCPKCGMFRGYTYNWQKKATEFKRCKCGYPDTILTDEGLDQWAQKEL